MTILRPRRRIVAALFVAGPAFALGFGPTHASATVSDAGELVYVANQGGGPVDVYSARSVGFVTPVFAVANPKRSNTFWDPWGVAFDSSGNLYVQSFLSDATTFVFGPSPMAAPEPIRIFRVNGPDSRSIAVDDKGYEYVGSGDAIMIAIAAPAADGRADNLYNVRAVRTFGTDENALQEWPDVLAEGTANELVAGILRGNGNAIETFAGGPHGGSTPLRVIAGPHSGLGSCSNACVNLSVAFSLLTNCIYVAVSDGSRTHISVFRRSANGDALPLRTIEGAITGLPGRVVTGIAVSPTTGNIYAMVKPDEFAGPARIDVFSSNATGNTAPMRTFTDRSNGFANAMGIAIHAG